MRAEYYSKKIFELSRMTVEEKDRPLVEEAITAYATGDYGKIDEVLIKLSPDYQLLEQLVGKLKGKSVFTGLKKLLEGKDQTVEQAIVSTSSLITHCALEIKENKEYTKLLPDLYTKLGILIGELK